MDSLERAEAEWEATRLAIIQRGAEGGFTTTKTVEKYTPGPNNTQMLVELRSPSSWSATTSSS